MRLSCRTFHIRKKTDIKQNHYFVVEGGGGGFKTEIFAKN